MGFWRRAAPGLALAGVALGLVAGYDRALRPAAAGLTAASADLAGGGGEDCATATDVTGDQVETRWGPVQVRAKVLAGGSVCESEAVVFPDGDGRSIEINDYALPILNAEVPDQGVAFDAVTGATVTSEGYRQSLQSILDSL